MCFLDAAVFRASDIIKMIFNLISISLSDLIVEGNTVVWSAARGIIGLHGP